MLLVGGVKRVETEIVADAKLWGEMLFRGRLGRKMLHLVKRSGHNKRPPAIALECHQLLFTSAPSTVGSVLLLSKA
jgi:hypothetical protein